MNIIKHNKEQIKKFKETLSQYDKILKEEDKNYLKKIIEWYQIEIDIQLKIVEMRKMEEWIRDNKPLGW